MLPTKPVRIFGVAAILVAAVAVGTLIGTVAGDWKAQASRHSRSQSLDDYLQHNLSGIEVGKPFPNIALWQVDGVTAIHLSELLPNGGMLFYVSSSCETCVDAIAALVAAQAHLGPAAQSVVIVTDNDPTPMLRTLAERGATTSILWDQQRLLDIEHNVRTTRTYFIVDATLTLVAMGTTGFDQAEYVQLLQLQ